MPNLRASAWSSSIDWRVIVFSFVLAAVDRCAPAASCPPRGPRLASSWRRRSTRDGIGSAPRLRARSAFVVAQVALSVLLVVCALLLASVDSTMPREIDPGFRVDGLEVVGLDLRLGGYDEAQEGGIFAAATDGAHRAHCRGWKRQPRHGSCRSRASAKVGDSGCPARRAMSVAFDATPEHRDTGLLPDAGPPVPRRAQLRGIRSSRRPRGGHRQRDTGAPGLARAETRSASGSSCSAGAGTPSTIIGVVRDAKYRTIGESPNAVLLRAGGVALRAGDVDPDAPDGSEPVAAGASDHPRDGSATCRSCSLASDRWYETS